jgi:hypothetical protein
MPPCRTVRRATVASQDATVAIPSVTNIIINFITNKIQVPPTAGYSVLGDKRSIAVHTVAMAAAPALTA